MKSKLAAVSAGTLSQNDKKKSTRLTSIFEAQSEINLRKSEIHLYVAAK